MIGLARLGVTPLYLVTRVVTGRVNCRSHAVFGAASVETQECPARLGVSYESVPQECPARVSPTRVSYKSVPQEKRLQECFVQECVPQECQTMFGRLFSSAFVHFGS